MYKNLVVAVSVSLLIIIPFCTGAQVTFQKTLGWGGYDIPASAQQSSDGSYVITGTSGGADIYLLKLDSVGDLLFSKTYGGTNTDKARSIQQTNDGGYIIAGNTTSWGSGIYLVKTDESGNVLWSKMYEGVGGSSIYQTSDNGYVITGFSSDGKIYLLKIDSVGIVDWSTAFDGPMASFNVGSSVQQTSDGGYIITGSSNNPEWPLGAVSDVWLIKTDSVGDTLWANLFVGISDDFGYCVQQTTDGGYIITGETWSSSFGITPDVFLIKTDSNGDTLWTRVYGGTSYDIGRSVQQTADGGYIIAGETMSFGGGNNDIYLIRTDSLGDTLWTKTYGGTSWDESYSIQQTSDGGFFVVGSTTSFGIGIDDFYLIKTDSMGNSGGCNEYGTNTTVGYFSFSMFPQITIDSIVTVDTNVITTVNNGSTNLIDQCDTSTSINQYTFNQVQIEIRPNPTTGLITVTGLPQEPAKITVYNVLGELVHGQELSGSNDPEIDLTGFPGGLYLLQVEYRQMTFRKKVIKQ